MLGRLVHQGEIEKGGTVKGNLFFFFPSLVSFNTRKSIPLHSSRAVVVHKHVVIWPDLRVNVPCRQIWKCTKYIIFSLTFKKFIKRK